MIDSMLKKCDELSKMWAGQHSFNQIKFVLESARPSERELMGRVEALEKHILSMIAEKHFGAYMKDNPTPSECKHRYNPALSGCCLDCGYNPNPSGPNPLEGHSCYLGSGSEKCCECNPYDYSDEADPQSDGEPAKAQSVEDKIAGYLYKCFCKREFSTILYCDMAKHVINLVRRSNPEKESVQ